MVAGSTHKLPSIDTAREQALRAGVADRVTFEVAGADDLPGKNFDLICVFNALHEWGDPVAAAGHIRDALAPDGTWIFTEQRTDDQPDEGVRARTFFSVSTFVCIPSALSPGSGNALGAQAGEAIVCRVTEDAGFTRFQRAAETPKVMILEVRP